VIAGVAAGVGADASAAAEPVCAPGQVSTKAKPCIGGAGATAATAAPGAVVEGGSRNSQSDSMTIVRFIDPTRNLYQIEVQNTSGIGYINSFNWSPPQGMTIIAVTSSEGGKCSLSNGDIECTAGGKGIAPPTCTCSIGGKMTVNFTATAKQPTFQDGYWVSYGVVGAYTQIQSMTPVPYHIPSFVTTTPGVDLPLCAKGEKSTKTKPCATG
jgi:hypothetical protein